jgi:hypothetical protein
MKPIRFALLLALVAASAPVGAAAAEDEEWAAFGHVLTLIQTVVRLGAQPYPDQAMADVLSGRNNEVNGALAGLLQGATADMPPQYRDRVASIGRDFAAYVAKHPGAAAVETLSAERSLQARKDLNAMGLRYHDERDYLDAVKRNDQLAVELFIAARGVNLDARTWTGRSALDIARDNGNTQLAELLSRSRP